MFFYKYIIFKTIKTKKEEEKKNITNALSFQQLLLHVLTFFILKKLMTIICYTLFTNIKQISVILNKKN